MADGLENAIAPLAMLNSNDRAIVRPEDFEALVRNYERQVFRVLYAQLRDSDAAATLTQECFLRAYQKRESFRGEASVSTWLIKIAVNLARDHVKSRRQSFWRRLFANRNEETESAAEQVAAPYASPERVLLVREELAKVMSAVEELSPQQRLVFTLRFVEDLSLEEIARALDLEIGTVKVHLSRAVGALRKKLKEGSKR
ncbi:MAG TPA: sigma-70 family RNA polymerase sigma factor [Terriglobales bacterium]|nr:sigma-70 family RNA polymerase sigma factor [Terriglobales bacterium]